MIAQIVEKPHLYPQRCFFTGDINEVPILDTGANDTEGGRVYISLSFFDDLVQAAGYLNRQQADALTEENARLRAQNSILPAVVERLIDAIRTASAAGIDDLLAGVIAAELVVPESVDSDAEGHAGPSPADVAAARQPRR
jgi:hypothetical protein